MATGNPYPMIYGTPALSIADERVLDLIADQRGRLRSFIGNSPRRWFGSLRRTTFARAIQGSNSIEGYHATKEEALALVDDEPLVDERTERTMALKGYRDAMTYVIQASHDSHFEFGKQFLKSLHFMMIGFDLSKYPGQWRPSGIFVVDSKSGQTVYEGPDANLVDGLVQELVDRVKDSKGEPSFVQGAMAHLNLTMIHPFKDGNGRLARALQTLVIARDGLSDPVFCSIEEWLGRNTQEYYAVLAETGQGIWNPRRSASAWVRFCLKAHYQQAETLLRRNEEYSRLFDGVLVLAKKFRLPERAELPLFDVALGFGMTNSRYRSQSDVTEFIASRDLKRMSEVGLLAPRGAGRGRVYGSGPALIELRTSVRAAKPKALDDPYVLVGAPPRPAGGLPAPVEPALPAPRTGDNPRLPGF